MFSGIDYISVWFRVRIRIMERVRYRDSLKIRFNVRVRVGMRVRIGFEIRTNRVRVVRCRVRLVRL